MRIFRPIVATLIPLAAVILQWIFWYAIQPFVWFLFYPAVFLSSWVGGLLWGLVATVISTAFVWWFFIPLVHTSSAQDPRTLFSVVLFMGMGILFSISHGRLRKANQQLQSANEEITKLYKKTRELDELKTQFFANVSHELRTPLALILGPVAKRLACTGLTPEERHDMEVVDRNARLLYRHVSDLLDVAKIEARRMVMQYTCADLARLVRFTASHFEVLAREKQIRFALLSPETLSAQIDEEKCRRILFNLLSNAFKFTPGGGAITLSLHSQGDCAILQVQDNGPGIPEDMHEAVFERFRQIEGGAERSHGGTGLGLAIAREFTKLHGGTIEVSDAPATGALFTVVLPLLAPMGAELQTTEGFAGEEGIRQVLEELRTPSSMITPPATTSSPDAPLVLVVEDNLDMNAFVAEVLGRYYRVAVAFDGEEGLAKALSIGPDLIVSDVMMPRMSGDQMVDALRRHKELDDVPIVILTAKADETSRVKLLREGVQDYLFKPFSVEELLAKVDGLVAERGKLGGLRAQLAAIVEYSNDAVVGRTKEGIVTSWNRSAERLFGYSEQEAVGQTMLVLLPPDRPNEERDILARVEQGERVDPWDTLRVTKEGRYIDVSVTISPIKDYHGRMIGSSTIARDIGERKRAEAALLESERKFKNFTEQALVGFYLIQDGVFKYVNRKFAQMFGYTVEECLDDMPFKDLIYEEDLAQVDEQVTRRLSGEIDFAHYTFRGLKKGGQILHGEIFGSTSLYKERPAAIGTILDIGDRRRAEESLRESEERLRSLINSTPDIVCFKDGEGRWLEANRADLELFELTGVDYRGKKDSELAEFSGFHREAFLTCEASDERTWRARTSTRADESIPSPDGTTKVFDVIKVPLFHTNGERKGLVVLGRDITERVRQEQEITLLNRLYAVLSKVSQAVVKATSPQAFLDEACRVIVEDGGFLLAWIGCVDPASHAVVPMAFRGEAGDYVDGITVYADDRPEGQGPTGTCLREMRPVVYNDFLHDPLAQPWHERAVRFGIRAVAAFPVESEGRTWGALTIYSDKIGFFGDKDMKLLEKVAGDIGFALDNLEKDARRLRAERALRESEEKLRNLFANAPVGIFRTNSRGQALSVNAAMARIMGYGSPEEAVERSYDLAAQHYVHAEKRDRFLQLLRERGRVEDFEYEARTSDGRTIQLSMNARVESKDKDGSFVIEGFTTDITERKRAEGEREKLQAQLNQAQKMEAVGRLAGGVAHDFNNMLSIIIGHAEMVLDELAPGEPFYHNLMQMKNAAERSADLTRQLLTFARKQTISPRVLDLNEIASGILKMLRRLIGEDIELVWIPGLDVWPVKIDPSQVDQILANLAVNARDAIGGVGTLSIETANVVLDETCSQTDKGFKPGSYVLLSVTDTGVGMDRETLDHIFEPFFTTKELGKGTGLGLATVYGIVEQNNGFIDVYSEPGQGSSFKIYLPRAEDQVEKIPARTGEKDLKGTETVLLVEDEDSILALGKTILERRGYTVLAAHRPDEALRMAESYPGHIHLLITDVVMPGMNGKDLREKLDPIKPGLKCIFMSGYTADVIAHHGILDKGIDFLQKPFSVKTLSEKVREVLDIKRFPPCVS